MNYEILKYIIIGVLLLGILLFILKSIVKTIIVVVIIAILFRIGWIYTSDDLKNSFLKNILNEDYIEDISDKYDDYVERRNNDNIIEPQKIEDTIREEINKKVNQYMNENN